jgi:hypothetical protein
MLQNGEKIRTKYLLLFASNKEFKIGSYFSNTLYSKELNVSDVYTLASP